MLGLHLFFTLNLTICCIFQLNYITVNSESEVEDQEYISKAWPNYDVSIKIVNELPNIENNIGQTDAELDNSNTRKKIKDVKPSPFSGPEQFQKLVGLCFIYLDEKYKYRFCPFQNITQDEVQFLQETYRGILGVWGEWIIEDNQFKAMHFLEGTKCGSGTSRSVKINVVCNVANRLVKITEPSKCRYEGVFETPLVCGNNSMVVYPRLSEELQLEWDLIETERHHHILTQKGYDEQLHQILVKVGYLLSPELKKELSQQLNEDNCNCEEQKAIREKKIEELQREILYKDELIRNLTQQIKNTS